MEAWRQHSGRLFTRDEWAVTLVDYVWRIEVPDWRSQVWPYVRRGMLPVSFQTAQEAMAYADLIPANAQVPCASGDAVLAPDPR